MSGLGARRAGWSVAWAAFLGAAGCQLLFGVDVGELGPQDEGGAGATAGMGSTPQQGAGGNTAASGTGGVGTGGTGGRAGSSSQGGAGGDGFGGSGGAGGSAGSGAGGGGGTGGSAGGFIVINEAFIDAPNSGPEAGCFIELKGPPGTKLDGYRLRGVNGNQTAPQPFYEELAFDVTHVIGANGYFVVAQDDLVTVAEGANSTIHVVGNLQNNGPDNVVLLDPDGNTVDALGYSDQGAPFVAPNVFRGEGAPAVLPPVNASVLTISRLPDGADTNDNSVDFGLGTQTPGAPNIAAPMP